MATQARPRRRWNEIYVGRLMVTERRGSPLWDPAPDRRRPLEYRREGIRIGDVGFITEDLGFFFVFNIFNGCSPDNGRQDLMPFDLPSENLVLSEVREPVDSILGDAVERRIHGRNSLSFSTRTESALLVLPEGATNLELKDIQALRRFIRRPDVVEGWYRYAIGHLGLSIQNGDLRVVTGTLKTTSWGMAVTQESEARTLVSFRSQLDDDDDDVDPSRFPDGAPQGSRKFSWVDCSGKFVAKIGPDEAEVDSLRTGAGAGVTMTGQFENQCLFLKALVARLSDKTWRALELELHIVDEEESGLERPLVDLRTAAAPSKGAQVLHPPTSSQTRRSLPSAYSSEVEIPDIEAFPRTNPAIPTRLLDNIPALDPPSETAIRGISKKLLDLFPHARLALLHDDNWCSVLRETDKVMPTISELWERIRASHEICEEDGVVFFDDVRVREDEMDPTVVCDLEEDDLPMEELHEQDVTHHHHSTAWETEDWAAEKHPQDTVNWGSPGLSLWAATHRGPRFSKGLRRLDLPNNAASSASSEIEAYTRAPSSPDHPFVSEQSKQQRHGEHLGQSRNARAQARHRAKRKAYIEELEQTVAKLQMAVGYSEEQVAALPSPLVRMKELEQANAQLRMQNDHLRRLLTDSGQTVFSDLSGGPLRDQDSRALNEDEVYLHEPIRLVLPMGLPTPRSSSRMK
ncbi:unnamed protein product [Cyclocybe aegerita]|uniref:BZIP domain-containing protein n=1 Tax=Cyclocybe aegerita TaxID=1973307 RepID=A0A8S0VZ79_CYCAE|nr:unnamed protein product [Cyclocybe aegerita]